jgi:hypothetical protein
MVYSLKKTSILVLLFTVYLVSLLVLAPSKANASTFNIATSLSPSVKIEVNHFIDIREGGLALVNDTITLSPGEDASLTNSFPVGFPFEYRKDQVTKERFYPDYCFAFDSNGALEVLPDIGLGRLGFYGVNVTLGARSSEQPYSFTIVFAFSNLIRASPADTQAECNVTFPLYPSLIQEVSSCLVKVFLPENATYVSAGKTFNVTSQDSSQILNLTKTPLAAFTSEPTWTMFRRPTFLVLEAKNLMREIKLDEWGRILCSESYSLINKGAVDLTSLKIRLPQGSYDVSANDEAGNSLSVSLQRGNATVPTSATISFTTKPLTRNVESTFTVTYWLPWTSYVNQYGLRDYDLSLAFFERQNFNWIIRKLTTTIILPEGADFIILPTLPENLRSKTYSSLQINVFQEILTFNFYNVTPFHDLNFNVSYTYLIFWASFRPTLWIGTIVAVVCAVVLLRRLPKRPEVIITPVPSKDLRNFVDAYEKKTSILSELILMEQQLQKGRIPRRKYKVRRKTLEGRLSILSHDLTELKEKLRRSSTRYAGIIGQIEVNETELEGLEADIKRVESRYKRGEISKGAYLRLLEEYHRRRDRARVTTDGILLRLKEEIV